MLAAEASDLRGFGVPMRISKAFATLAMAALISLTAACDSSPECETPTATPQINNQPAVVEIPGFYNNNARLKCNREAGYVAVEIAKGSYDADGANYVFEEKLGVKGPYKDVQQEVKLYVQPPAGVAVISAIVHSVDSADTEYVMNLPTGGKTDVYLKTAKYAYLPEYYNNFPINSVTFCTKRSS